MCADLVYNADAVAPLAHTLARLLLQEPPPGAGHAPPRAVCAFPDRVDFGRRRPAAAEGAARTRPYLERSECEGQPWWCDGGSESDDGSREQQQLAPDFEMLFELLAEEARALSWRQL